MIIQCDNCKAKFQLDEFKVPEQGRKVRCSKCKHEFWAQKPAPPPEEPLDVRLDEEELSKMAAEESAPPQSEEAEETFEPTVRMDITDQEGPGYKEEREGEEYIPPPPRPRRRGVGKPIGIIVILVLILAAAAFVLYRMQMLPFLTPPPEEPTANLTIDPVELTGKWETNAQVPRIFLIQGSVQNLSKQTKAFIKVRALLLDKNDKTLREAWAYCGNRIPPGDLRTKSPGEIQKRMRNRKGFRGMNQSLAPGATIPFTIVFFDVPTEVEKYRAEVIEAFIPQAS